MTRTQQLVIPEPESFGFRVNARTPLAHVVAVLRRHNPQAPYPQIKLAAEQLRLGTHKVTREPRPEPFDSATDSGAGRGGTGDGPAESAPESAVAPDPARLDEIENGKIKRAAAADWARANGMDVPAKGFLPAALIVAYRAHLRGEYLASLTPVVNADGSPAEPMPADVPATEVH